jgi:hypothetical protein
MSFIDYTDSKHKNCGEFYHSHQDILITPFWTENFCNKIKNIAECFADFFTHKIVWDDASDKNKNIGWKDITFESIDSTFFNNFVGQYKEHICPLLQDFYKIQPILGWFNPYIIKYDQPGDCTDLHNDQSMITLNIKLNNNYKGCDLIFPRQNFSTKEIPVGYATIWPSTVTHPHYSTPLIEGVKYSVISWSWPPHWNMSGIKNN